MPGLLSIPFPTYLKGGSVLPQGQTLVGMFVYRLVAGIGRCKRGSQQGRGQ